MLCDGMHSVLANYTFHFLRIDQMKMIFAMAVADRENCMVSVRDMSLRKKLTEGLQNLNH